MRWLRKLLVKLVAIETALLGWLSYWLFLVYANNPSVAAELGSNLQRFPQLSFSTVDIAVLVIIAALAVTLAFKFQRGLRPGIRLERALQMLENLMKRNLVLEAQVAELKIEKSHSPPVITSAPAAFPEPTEPRPGSWEKAFRTPLEAGPPIQSKASPTATKSIPFGRETGIPPPRIEPNPQPNPPIVRPPLMIDDQNPVKLVGSPPIISEKTIDKTNFPPPPKSSASSWEDSPQFIGESKGILTPSQPPRRVPTVSDSGGLKQPYIPAPAPKQTPPSVIVGPISSPIIPKITPLSTPPKITARPTNRSTAKPPVPIANSTIPPVETPKQEAETPPLILPAVTPSAEPSTRDETSNQTGESLDKPREELVKVDEKTVSKSVQPARKKSSMEKTDPVPKSIGSPADSQS